MGLNPSSTTMGMALNSMVLVLNSLNSTNAMALNAMCTKVMKAMCSIVLYPMSGMVLNTMMKAVMDPMLVVKLILKSLELFGMFTRVGQRTYAPSNPTPTWPLPAGNFNANILN